MKLLAILSVLLILLVLISELSAFSVVGKLLSDKETAPFLEARLSEYKLNCLDNTILSHLSAKEDLPYIATLGFTVTSKWYIEDYGRVPRWSEAHKMIKARRDYLLFYESCSTTHLKDFI
jgi:hypothetical protein